MNRVKEAQGLSFTEMAYIIGVLYEAGSDTTSGILDFFVLACLMFPEAVRKAHHELDQVVGSEKLPSFDDLPNLPYVDAFVKEVMRWRPLAPLGVPHSVIEDDEYMGYHIPKGATIFPNHWVLGTDTEVFDNPAGFMPERWIDNPNLPFTAFGFGRRVCTGRHIAMNSLQIIVSRVLWAYNIDYAYEDGRKVDVNPLAMVQSAIPKPVPFKADFQIRSPKHCEVVQSTWEGTEKDLDAIMEGVSKRML